MRRTATVEEAVEMLWTSAANSATGLIYGPTGPGYTLPNALGIVYGAILIVLDDQNGTQILAADWPGHGTHSWFLNLTASTKDPWA